MIISELSLEEQIKTGCTHSVKVTHEDLAKVGALTTTLPVFAYAPRDVVRSRALLELAVPFTGPDVATLSAKLGHHGATVSDDDSLIASTALAGAGALPATVGTGTAVAFVEAGDLELVFTATGASLAALTAGAVNLYFGVTRLAGLHGINAT